MAFAFRRVDKKTQRDANLFWRQFGILLDPLHERAHVAHDFVRQRGPVRRLMNASNTAKAAYLQ